MDMLGVPLGAKLERIPSPSFLPRDEDIVELLKSPDFDSRLQTLSRIISLSKRDSDWFTRFTKKGDLFKNLDRILTEDRWEVQHECVRFLYEAMPSFGSNLEYCMCYVMPHLVPKLGSSKITIRKVTVQTLQRFTQQHPTALPTVLKMIVNFVLGSPQQQNRHELLNEIQSLYQPYLQEGNWQNLVDGFTKWMAVADAETIQRIAVTLKKLEVFVGLDVMERMLSELPTSQQIDYIDRVRPLQLDAQQTNGDTNNRSNVKSGERKFRFGIVPTYIGSMLTEEDPNTKIAALEKLKLIMEKITPEDINKLIPHLHSFFVSLGHVLNDLNFKVVVLSLDLLRLTVNRLKGNIDAHLQQVTSLLSRHFGNQKAVVKQILIMTCMDLFRNLNPKSVVAVLCVFLEHRNSRVREEVLNILTAALLQVSPGKVNLTAVANLLLPRLIDPKRRVRLAAFEHLSVLAFQMNGKLEPIMKLVREVEEKGWEGLSGAVKARIDRKSLPRIRYDGLIEYSTPPVTDSSFDVDDEHLQDPANLDLNWILHGKENRTPSPTALFTSFKSTLKAAITIQHKRNVWEQEKEIEEEEEKEEKPESFVHNLDTSGSSWGSSTSRATKEEKKEEQLEEEDEDEEEDEEHERDDNHNDTKREQPSKLKKTVFVKKHFEARKKIGELVRAKSETKLTDDKKENLIPDDEQKDYHQMPVKSASHHSLPINHSHPPLRQQQSQPLMRKGNFLRAGANNRVKPAAGAPKGAPVLAPRQATQLIHNNTLVQGSPSIQTALKKMDSEDWNEKVDGINMISDISANNPKAICDNLNDVVTAVLRECQNLRSSVSRAAIACMGTLFANLRNKMDPVTEKTTSVLMARSGDVSSAFIREDATEAIEQVAKHASPPRVLASICQTGAKSKNNTIRTACSSLVAQIVGRIGPSATLANGEFLTKLMPVLIHFSKDPTPKVRQHAKLALISLSQDRDFDRQMRKYCSDKDLAEVKGILGTIQKKGVPESLDSSMSGGGGGAGAGSLSRNGSTRRSISRKVPDSLQMDLDEIKADLVANAWERRITGVKRFEEMASTSSRFLASNTTLIEAYIARLSDINSKVSLDAMSTYLATLPQMARFYSSEASLKAVLNQLLLALSSHLSSKSEDHRHLAHTCLQQTVAHIDSCALSSHFAAVTKKANVKQKPFLLHLFTKLNQNLYSTKPKQVEVVALPILWDCLKTPVADAEHKRAIADLARSMAHLMGDRALLDAASSALEPSKKSALEALIR